MVGKEPPPGFDERIKALLATVEPVTLPEEVVATLTARRSQAQKLGPWVQGHHRPGQAL